MDGIGEPSIFWTTGQAAMNHNLLNEIATSGAISDPVLFIYGVLGTLTVATLATSYLFFGRHGQDPVDDWLQLPAYEPP